VADRVLNVKVLLAGAAKAQGELAKIEKTGRGVGGAFGGVRVSWLAVAAAAGVASIAISKFKGFMDGAVNDAIEAQRPITELNAAMKDHGIYTDQATAAIQQYNIALGRKIAVDDDDLNAISARISKMTQLGAVAIPLATQATAQLAEITGMNLDSAVRAVSKTLEGTTNTLKRYGIEVDMAGTAEERLNQILEQTKTGLSTLEAKAETHEGAVKAMRIAWGNFRETLGGFVTSSPEIVKLIHDITTAVEGLNDYLKDPKVREGIDNFVSAFRTGIGAIIADLRDLKAWWDSLSFKDIGLPSSPSQSSTGPSYAWKHFGLTWGTGEYVPMTMLEKEVVPGSKARGSGVRTRDNRARRAMGRGIHWPGINREGMTNANWARMIGADFAGQFAGNYSGGGMGEVLGQTASQMGGEWFGGMITRSLGSKAAAGMLGSSIGSFAGPIGTILGAVVGSLIGDLFKKKQRQQVTEPLVTKDLMVRDLLSQLLNITKQSLNRAGARGVDRLNNLRLAQAVVG